MTTPEPRLHVELRGHGPAVLMMHGLAGSARNLRPQARALEDRYRVLSFDARGHARSEAPHESGSYSAGRLIADVARVLDSAGEARAVVGGISMGAAVALRFALERKERVRALILAAPPGEGTAVWARDFAEDIERNGLEAAGDRRVWGAGARFDPESAALIRRGFLEHPPHALVGVLREFLPHAVPAPVRDAELAQLDVPCCVIVGAEDAPSLPTSRRLAEAIPSAELHVIEGAGHALNLTHRDRFNEVLLRFLDALPLP